MRKALAALLPLWARPDHPILQYELAQLRQAGSRRRRFMRLLLSALLLGGAGYGYAAFVYDTPASGGITDFVWRSLYFPTLLVQIITCASALSLGIGAVGGERRRRTWDPLRATEIGAALTLRTRWLAILYRLRAPILAILLVRLCLSAGMVYDLSAFGGRYAEMLSQNITPALADWRLGLLLLSLNMTAGLLLPLIAIAAAAAIGILISVAIKERVYTVLAQLLLTLLHIAFTAAALFLIAQFLTGRAQLPDAALFALFAGFSGLGDWGLLLTQLGSLGEIWARVPYGAFIGSGLLLLLLLQTALSDATLWLAVRLAENRE